MRTQLGLLALASTLLPAPSTAGTPLQATSELLFHHFNGMTGELLYPEMLGGGAALFDYDGDGDLDLWISQGNPLRPLGADESWVLLPSGELPLSDRLFRNDLGARLDGTLAPRWVDVTERSRVAATGYGMGVTVADVDGDGWVDVYLLNLDGNELWRNRGDGTFEEVAAAAGVADDSWSLGATFFDADGDGDLDLFVVDYVEVDLDRHPSCYDRAGRPDYCGPTSFAAAPDRFYRNRGDGTFEDVTVSAGVARPAGRGMGVVAADLDDDGDQDVYVANDGEPNFLWINQGDGTFRDNGLLAGVAVNAEGRPEASMGVDVADFDHDGDLDLFVTHLREESNTLYVNDGGGLFTDRSRALGLAGPSLPFTTFGVRWADLDADGWLDLLVANGEVRLVDRRRDAGDRHPLGQPDQAFRSDGRTFREENRLPASFAEPLVGRGLATGDLDHDGAVDAVVINNAGPARLHLGSARGAGWIGVAPRLANGAPAERLSVEVRSGDRRLLRWAHSDGSYASASDPRVTVASGEPPELLVVADGARVRRLLRPPTGVYLVLPRWEVER